MKINEHWLGIKGPYKDGVLSSQLDIPRNDEKLVEVLIDYHWNYWRLRRRVEELEKEFVDERNQSVLSEPI